MIRTRIIPRLDVKGKNLVKGIHLEGLRIVGDPWSFAEKYYEDGADELLFMDAVASLYGRNSLYDIVKKTAENIFIPLTVGGGIRTTDDIRNLLMVGADRVAINTQAIKTPAFISQAANRFGTSTIALSIETKQQSDGSYHAYTDNGREDSGLDVVEWAKQAVDLGVGEILMTSIDKDGTGDGFDVELIETVSKSVSIPVVASGGAGTVGDIKELIKTTGINGVGLASIIHYPLIDKQKLPNNSGGGFNVIQESYSRGCEGVPLEQILKEIRIDDK
jgi:cyclase